MRTVTATDANLPVCSDNLGDHKRRTQHRGEVLHAITHFQLLVTPARAAALNLIRPCAVCCPAGHPARLRPGHKPDPGRLRRAGVLHQGAG